MTRISRIGETKRGRYSLFDEEGEFLFSVDEETLVKHNICEGSTLTGEELSLLRSASDTRKAKDGALRFLSLRAYGEEELYRKLCLKYDEPSCAAAVAAMKELELLDDITFACEKAKGMAQRGKSTFEIRQKLRSLGIDKDTIEIALDGAETDDYATAYQLVCRKYGDKLLKGEREKVLAALGRRGYPRNIAYEAVDNALQELNNQQLETQ